MKSPMGIFCTTLHCGKNLKMQQQNHIKLKLCFPQLISASLLIEIFIQIVVDIELASCLLRFPGTQEWDKISYRGILGENGTACSVEYRIAH